MKVTLEHQDGKEQIVVTVRADEEGNEYAFLGDTSFEGVDHLTWVDNTGDLWFEIENDIEDFEDVENEEEN